jgi:hypothetical protein
MQTGSPHWLEIHFCPSMGPNGGSVATDSVLINLSEQKSKDDLCVQLLDPAQQGGVTSLGLRTVLAVLCRARLKERLAFLFREHCDHQVSLGHNIYTRKYFYFYLEELARTHHRYNFWLYSFEKHSFFLP